jgi:hypothetical protein
MLSLLFLAFLLPSLAQADIRLEFRTETIKGEDGVERKVEVLLPTDTTDTTNPNRKFPVVYYFSGYKTENAWPRAFAGNHGAKAFY